MSMNSNFMSSLTVTGNMNRFYKCGCVIATLTCIL